MSLKSVNRIDNLYDQLFQAQIEHRWEDADKIQRELRSLEKQEGESPLVEDQKSLWTL